MLEIDEIIIEKFGKEEFTNTKLVFDKYGLTRKIELYLGLINNHIERIDKELKIFGFINISALASILLVESNNLVGSFSENEIKEKNDLKNKLGSFYQCVLVKLVKQHKTLKEKEAFLSDIFYALLDVCILKDYDISDLFDFLKLPTIEDELEASEIKDIVADNIIKPEEVFENDVLSYVWNSNNDNGQSKFYEILVELEICKNVDNFKELFHEPISNLNIELNENKVNYVMIFLICLKDSSLITYSGRTGFYKVLQCHVKNFDEIFLDNLEPKRRVDNIKRSVKFHQIKSMVDEKLKECI